MRFIPISFRYESDLEIKNAELEEAQQFISKRYCFGFRYPCRVRREWAAFLQVNPAFQRITGLSQKDLLGASLADFLVEEDRASVDLQKIAEGVAGKGHGMRLRFSGGGPAPPISWRSIAARVRSYGSARRRRAHGRPIGELKRAYEALHRAHRELQQAQRKSSSRKKWRAWVGSSRASRMSSTIPSVFIYGNIHTLDKYRGALAEYFENSSVKTQNDELRRRYRIDAILADLPSLIEGTMDGAVRISDIVRNLRRLSFSRPAETQRVDLEGIARTAANWAARSKKTRRRNLFRL